MAWAIGSQYETNNGATATIAWGVGQWIGGYAVQGQGAPLAMRWNKTTGVSDQPGLAFNLKPIGGSVWVAVFYTGQGPISARVKDSKAEADQFGNSHGNTLIQSFEVVL